MAATVSTVGTVNPLSLNSSSSGDSVPRSVFLGSSLKKVNSRFTSPKVSSGSFKVVAEVEEDKQTNKDKWKGLAFDTSDDQQDITRGKGMVDSLFQAPMGTGTHYAIMSSYDYISAGLRQYNLDNNMDGFYIAPAFMDKLVVHITKNFMTLPFLLLKVPAIADLHYKYRDRNYNCKSITYIQIDVAFNNGKPTRAPPFKNMGKPLTQVEKGNAILTPNAYQIKPA